MAITQQVKSPGGGAAELAFVADLIGQALAFERRTRGDDEFTLSHRRSEYADPGIITVHGKLADSTIIMIRMELLRAPIDVRLSVNTLFSHLSELGSKIKLIPPEPAVDPGFTSLWIELGVQATPMSIARSNAFVGELKKLDQLANDLQSQLPETLSDQNIVRKYSDVSDYLMPVMPCRGDLAGEEARLLDWALETAQYLDSRLPVALSASCAVVESFALSLISRACTQYGTTLGQVAIPAVNAKVLIEIAAKSPGAIAVPAVRLSLAANPYEVANETNMLLELVGTIDKPFVFTGSRARLQKVFHGGQGGSNDPLNPVVRHAPAIPLELLTRHAVDMESLKEPGLTSTDKDSLVIELLDPLSNLPPAKAMSCLPAAAAQAVRGLIRGGGGAGARQAQASASGGSAQQPGQATAANPGVSMSTQPSAREASNQTQIHVDRLAGLKETFAGLRNSARAGRDLHVQDNFVRTFTNPDFLAGLKSELHAQDEALETLSASLARQSLNRTAHQPIRYCAQGTPGTGKTRSAELVAESLGIPYINFDAATVNDPYTASALLLGSGRGIVGSHESGELEKAAKHHSGALLEISDMDHARPEVRSKLASVFLGILESGEAQSSIGPKFSCANLIFAFTINLADGKDEAVRRNIGFGDDLTWNELKRRVSDEIKDSFSTAFLSRIGAPILFAPLNGEALAVIIEREIERSVTTSLERLHIAVGGVEIEAGTGRTIMAALDCQVTATGAREIHDQVCELTGKAVLEFAQRHPDGTDGILMVSAAENGELTLSREAASAAA